MNHAPPRRSPDPASRTQGPPDREMSFAQGVIVRLLRLWSAAVTDGTSPMPVMVGAVVPLGLSAEAGIAAASLFELVEERLGRPMRPECCCSRALSTDERAILGLIDYAPWTMGQGGSVAIPHGLPAVVGWAVMALRRALHMTPPAAFKMGRAGQVCPFAVSTPSVQAFS